jgi:hypothetical protein
MKPASDEVTEMINHVGVTNVARRGHQCSETMLTGESRFHISTPPGDLNLGPL